MLDLGRRENSGVHLPCREVWDYGSRGELLRFCVRGGGGFGAEEGIVLDVRFSYREDGTLAGKTYGHDPALLGTTGSPAEVVYDAWESPVFLRCYITHGHLEYYNFYTEQARQSGYCLFLDFCGGACYGELHRR